MKKIFYSAMACAAMMLAGCEVNTSDNGKLDGFWQMTRVDTLITGGTTDMRDSLLFWSVQGPLLGVRDSHADRHLAIFFNFKHEGGRLELFNPIADNRMISDSVITCTATISYTGVNSLRETFDVKTLENEKMVLESEHHLRLHFRKY